MKTFDVLNEFYKSIHLRYKIKAHKSVKLPLNIGLHYKVTRVSQINYKAMKLVENENLWCPTTVSFKKISFSE